MRCDTVMRELSAPGGLDRSALADHLSGCPSCESWAARVGDLDRIWDATRPDEPSPEAFDALWARATARAETPSLPIAPRAKARWSRWGLMAAAGAQAAALLIGAMALLFKPTPVAAAVPSVTAEEGRTLIVTLRDGLDPTVVENPHLSESDTDTVAVEFDILGYMESIK